LRLRRLARAVEGITRTFEVIAETALVALLVLVAHEVFVRYVLNAPTQFSVEISEYLLVLITFLSAGWVLREDRHVRVLFVVDRLSPRAAEVAALVSYAVVLAFCLILVWQGGAMTWSAFESGDRSSSLVAFPLWIAYGFIPLGALVLALQCAVRLAEAWARLRARAHEA